MPTPPTRHLEMRNIPVDLYGRYAEHVDRVGHAALTVEAKDPTTTAELRHAAHVIVHTFGPLRARARQAHAEAVAREDTIMELILDVPEEIATAMVDFLDAVEQLDSAARTGKADLPVAPSDVAAFRRWLIGEAVAQRDGQEPTPFSARVLRVLGPATGKGSSNGESSAGR